MTSNKLILCLNLLLGVYWAASAAQQTPRILRFTPSVIEIGTVRYDGGPVTVSFECENIAPKPVTILEVRPQCGCTKPEYSRKSIGPGKKTTVKVTFDPSDTFGEQKRYLTVIATNGDYRKFNTLEVHGFVERDQTEAQIRFPYLLGEGLRTELETVGLRKRKAGEVVRRSIVLYNDGGTPLFISWKRNRRVGVVPGSTTLAPGERTTLEIQYRTRGMKAGEFTDSFILLANGTELNPIILQGTIE